MHAQTQGLSCNQHLCVCAGKLGLKWTVCEVLLSQVAAVSSHACVYLCARARICAYVYACVRACVHAVCRACFAVLHVNRSVAVTNMRHFPTEDQAVCLQLRLLTLAYMMQRLHCMHTHGRPAASPQLKASSLCVDHVHVKHMAAALKHSRERSQFHLKTAALLPKTKSSRSSTNGRGSVGAFSHFSMPSLAACNQAGLRPSCKITQPFMNL